jgi:hypothetical protein
MLIERVVSCTTAPCPDLQIPANTWLSQVLLAQDQEGRVDKLNVLRDVKPPEPKLQTLPELPVTIAGHQADVIIRG